MLNKRLGEEIRAVIAKKDMQHKEVAIAFAQRAKLKESTAISDLSELVQGKPGGDRPFFESDARTTALAKALRVDLAWLRDLHARCTRGRYLILDPALDPEAAAFLRRQQGTTGGDYECIEVPSGRTVREVADEYVGCIVVLRLPADGEVAYFEGRRIATTGIKHVPRGFELLQAPGMVPVPPPSPPAAWSGEYPLFAHPDLTAQVRTEAASRRLDPTNVEEARRSEYMHERGKGAEKVPGLSDLSLHEVSRLARQVFAADERGEEPAFTFHDIAPWLMAHADGTWHLELPQVRSSRHQHPRQDQAVVALSLEHALQGPTSTIVWWWKKRLLAMGPSAAAFADLVRPQHKVAAPGEIDDWRAALEVRNPFDPSAFNDLVEAARCEAGVSLTDAMGEWRRRIAADDASPSDRQGRDDKQATERQVLGWSREDERAARAALSALAARPMKVPMAETTLALRLRAASRAPLILVAKNRFDVAHVIASLGAGRVLRVRIAQFEGAGTGELTLSAARSANSLAGTSRMLELDGDGTHAWVESLYDEELEGMYVRARARRADAEAARRDDD